MEIEGRLNSNRACLTLWTVYRYRNRLIQWLLRWLPVGRKRISPSFFSNWKDTSSFVFLFHITTPFFNIFRRMNYISCRHNISLSAKMQKCCPTHCYITTSPWTTNRWGTVYAPRPVSGYSVLMMHVSEIMVFADQTSVKQTNLLNVSVKYDRGALRCKTILMCIRGNAGYTGQLKIT